MKSIIEKSFVDLSFWGNIKDRTRTPAAASLSSARSHIDDQVTPQTLTQLRSTPERASKRPRIDNFQLMLNSSISDEITLSELQTVDKKPAAKVDITAVQQRIHGKDLNKAAITELAKLAHSYPDTFLDDGAAIPSDVNAESVKTLTEMREKHSDNPNLLAFVQRCYGQFIKRPGKVAPALNKRHELIEHMLTAEPVNSYELAILQNDRLQEVIFPEQKYRNVDLKKLILMRELLSSRHDDHYTFLVANAKKLADNDNTQVMQYAMAVVATRIAKSQPYDFGELLKQKPMTLAKELLISSAEDSLPQALALADKMMAATSKDKGQMGAKLLVFLAENPDVIAKLNNVMQRPDITVGADEILRLINKDKDCIQLYGDCLRHDDHAIEEMIVSYPHFLTQLDCNEFIKLKELLSQYRDHAIANFYPPNESHDIVNLFCEVIRRHVESGALQAKTSDERDYVTAASSVNKALFRSLVLKSSTLAVHDRIIDRVIALHQSLSSDINVHSAEQFHELIHKATVLSKLLNSGQYIAHDVLPLVTGHFDLIRNLSVDQIEQFLNIHRQSRELIIHMANGEMGPFITEHLPDLCQLSNATLRELEMIRNLPPHIQVPRLLRGLDRQWPQFMALDDINRQRHIRRGIDILIRLGARNEVAGADRQQADQVGIHSQQVTSMVDNTIKALLAAFKKSGWQAQSSAGAAGRVVVEPISSAVLEIELATFKSNLQIDMMKSAAQIKGINAVPDFESAIAIHRKIYDQIKQLADSISHLQNNLRQLKDHPQPSSESAQKIRHTLAKEKKRLNELNTLTRPYGAYQYLTSKHLESDPKNVGSLNFQITLKQLLGMALTSSQLNHDHVNWHEGLDTPEKRTEAVHERLTEALHDSHIAYLGTLHANSDSCWDGGVNRIMLAVRTVIDFDLMPNSSDFAAEFRRIVVNTLELLAKPEILNNPAPDTITLRQQLRQQITSDHTVSEGLWKLVKPRVLFALGKSYPQMRKDVNSSKTRKMLAETSRQVTYIDLPPSFLAAYTADATSAESDIVTEQGDHLAA